MHPHVDVIFQSKLKIESLRYFRFTKTKTPAGNVYNPSFIQEGPWHANVDEMIIMVFTCIYSAFKNN